MLNKEDIVFSPESGISIEEQKEILTQINGIAEKNRRSLSQGGKTAFKAKKSGVFFPLAVNVAALIILGSGALFLIWFNGRMDAQVRTGKAVYNLTERALVEEIRGETEQRIAAKEMEIFSIVSQLEEIDAQLLQLQSENQELTSEQLAAQKRLLVLQASYGEELSALQEEKAQILEASRLQEAGFRTLLEQRSRETSEQITSGEPDFANGEFDRLAGERETIAALDAQFAGGLFSVSRFARDGKYDQAGEMLESLRDFCNSNSLSSLNSFAARKEFYNKTLDSMETMIAHLRISGDSIKLFTENTQIKNTLAEMQKTIDAFSSGSSGQARRLAELEAELDEEKKNSKSEKESLTQTIAARDSSIKDLEAENAARTQEISSLRNQLDVIRQALQE